MNVSAISFNPTKSSQVGYSKKLQNKMMLNPNNSNDIFELSAKKTNNIAFKSLKSEVTLSTQEGVTKMINHFSALKIKNSANATKIDKVKNFILGINESVKKAGGSMKVSWQSEGKTASLSNTIYSFGNTNEKTTSQISGFGHSLSNFIEEVDKLEKTPIKELEEANNPVVATYKRAFQKNGLIEDAKDYFAARIVQRYPFKLEDASKEFNNGLYFKMENQTG